MNLDFTPLEKALITLKRGIDRAIAAPNDEELRDAVIQRFEYSYELCWRMLKRQLEQEVANPAIIDTLSFRQLIREGAERGIIDHVENWFEYRRQRNITSHVYDQEKAKSVFQTALNFYPEAIVLLQRLLSRNV